MDAKYTCGSNFGVVYFFLTQIKNLRSEDVVHCADCKAH